MRRPGSQLGLLILHILLRLLGIQHVVNSLDGVVVGLRIEMGVDAVSDLRGSHDP